MTHFHLNTMAALSMIITFGCAHVAPLPDPQAKSKAPEEYQVQIGSEHLQDGDSVWIIKTTCRPAKVRLPGHRHLCQDQVLGEGKVLKILDPARAIISPFKNIKIEPGMRAKKKTDQP